MSKRDSSLLVSDIIDSSQKILDYTYGLSYEKFTSDSKTVDAVVRNFEIIGEAANLLPEQCKDSHQDIDWHRIRGFRNRIIHHYFGIDNKIVWQIKETFLPERLKNLKSL